jgi:hypothetical protein
MTSAKAIDLETRLINAGIEHTSVQVLGDVKVTAVSTAGVLVDTVKTVADVVGCTAKALRVEFS